MGVYLACTAYQRRVLRRGFFFMNVHMGFMRAKLVEACFEMHVF